MTSTTVKRPLWRLDGGGFSDTGKAKELEARPKKTKRSRPACRARGDGVPPSGMRTRLQHKKAADRGGTTEAAASQSLPAVAAGTKKVTRHQRTNAKRKLEMTDFFFRPECDGGARVLKTKECLVEASAGNPVDGIWCGFREAPGGLEEQRERLVKRYGGEPVMVAAEDVSMLTSEGQGALLVDENEDRIIALVTPGSMQLTPDERRAIASVKSHRLKMKRNAGGNMAVEKSWANKRFLGYGGCVGYREGRQGCGEYVGHCSRGRTDVCTASGRVGECTFQDQVEHVMESLCLERRRFCGLVDMHARTERNVGLQAVTGNRDIMSAAVVTCESVSEVHAECEGVPSALLVADYGLCGSKKCRLQQVLLFPTKGSSVDLQDGQRVLFDASVPHASSFVMKSNPGCPHCKDPMRCSVVVLSPQGMTQGRIAGYLKKAKKPSA